MYTWRNDTDETTYFCVIEGILKVALDLSSMIWTTLIIYSVFASVVKKEKQQLEKHEVLYLFIGFVFPLALSCIPISIQGYSFDGYYCYLRNDEESTGFWLRFVYLFVPMWVLFFTNMTLAILTYRQLKKIEMPPQLMKIFTRILLFPLILLVTGIFETIDVIYMYAVQDRVDWLYCMGIVFMNLYGLLTSIAYGLNPLIRQRIRACVSKAQTESFISDTPEYRSSGYSDQIRGELMEMTQSKKMMSLNERQIGECVNNRKRSTEI